MDGLHISHRPNPFDFRQRIGSNRSFIHWAQSSDMLIKVVAVDLLSTIDHPKLIRSLTLCEPPVRPLLENVAGGDTIMNNFLTKAVIPAVSGFNKNDSRKAAAAFLNGVIGDSLFWFELSQQTQTIMMDNTL